MVNKKIINPKVSIIVPIYNSALFLDACLNSLVKQTYDNIEILLIEDGSLDDSRSICKKWVKTDSRIKLFCQKNHGVSYSRNKGIKNSTGEWVVFVDSDDFLEHDYIEDFLSSLDRNIDFAFCNYYSYTSSSTKRNIYYFGKKNLKLNSSRLFLQVINKKSFYPANINFLGLGSVWGKFYRRDFLIKNNIFFNEEICFSEDRLFQLKVLSFSKGNFYLNKLLYYYRVDNNSSYIRSFSELFLSDFKRYFSTLCLVDFGSEEICPFVVSEFCRGIHLCLKKFFFNKSNKLSFFEKRRLLNDFLNTFSFFNNSKQSELYEKLVFEEKVFYFCLIHKFYFSLLCLERLRG